jgi:hypothetical protein
VFCPDHLGARQQRNQHFPFLNRRMTDAHWVTLGVLRLSGSETPGHPLVHWVPGFLRFLEGLTLLAAHWCAEFRFQGDAGVNTPLVR